MSNTLLILGASARAAAFSALRSGWQPRAADLFADADLAARADVVRIDDYPAGLLQAAAAAPPGAWLYTGGLENYPRLVERIARRRELWGNGGQVLAAVRDPLAVASALAAGGLPHPQVRRQAAGLPTDGSWLAKPCRGAAGAGIFPWQGAASLPKDASGNQSYYYQQRTEGRSQSAVYLGHAGGAALLGVTEQLIAQPWCGARSFQYCGSLGPLSLSSRKRQAWQRIGACLAGRFGLRGLFGVDAIVNDKGIWPVEVNPRYTASVEILEWAGGTSALAAHAAACTGRPCEIAAIPETARSYGKAILFAAEQCRVDARFTAAALAEEDSSGWPLWGDVPPAGTRIVAGRPVLTAFASGEDRPAVVAELERRLDEARRRLARNATKASS